MALVPLLWLGIRGERRAVYWWIAIAFAVSWVADSAAHFGNPWFIATVYPVSQAGIVVLLLARAPREATAMIGLLMVAGLVAVLWEGTTGPDLFLKTIAAGTVVSVLWPLEDRHLRAALLVAFDLGWVMWVTYVLWPGWTTWGMYQGVRAVSLGMFCLASWKPAVRVIA